MICDNAFVLCIDIISLTSLDQKLLEIVLEARKQLYILHGSISASKFCHALTCDSRCEEVEHPVLA